MACKLLKQGRNNNHALWGWYAASVSDDGGVHSLVAYERAVSAFGLSLLCIAPPGPTPPAIATALQPLIPSLQRPNSASTTQRRANNDRRRRTAALAALLDVVLLERGYVKAQTISHHGDGCAN
jgi:hypothetical protein